MNNSSLMHITCEISRLSSLLDQSMSKSIYGSDVKYQQKTSDQSTSLGEYINNLTINRQSDGSETYSIELSFIAASDSPLVKLHARIRHNDSSNLWAIRTPLISSAVNDSMPFSFFAHKILDPGYNAITFDFRNVGVGTITISHSAMRLIRVK